ncbi:GDYXXLXY domain-containing protein [Oceanicaulis sp. MMSF_3324]|uniref:GDYXXLXY domain-containing protein n=1 Tax=Oceanicaulis sp. MMSF_3324 TaxID=3046702 RepID=UPI00273D6D26|nr:GDYXXLXY domain-containing protein [Oceanicaulis sp. MMSF_3324]
MIRISYLARAGLGLAVILALLGWMTFSNERARSSGHEVLLQTYPIDPRDVFFGHYAVLSYRDFNTGDVRLSWPAEQGLEAGDFVYFTLTTSGPFHQPGESFATLDEAAAQGGPVLKAELFPAFGEYGDSPERFYVRFVLPRQYFADPETAMAIQADLQTVRDMQQERSAWERCLDLQEFEPEEFERASVCDDFDPDNAPTTDIPQYGAILSVSETGEAVIKGLYYDGERVIDSLTGPRFVRERTE